MAVTTSEKSHGSKLGEREEVAAEDLRRPDCHFRAARDTSSTDGRGGQEIVARSSCTVRVGGGGVCVERL